MTTFHQLHLLTSYPPANLNRDDTGRPKTALMGGAMRLRVSSQSLKRAWRTSDIFAKRLERALSLRTRRMGTEVHERLTKQHVAAEIAEETARLIGGRFGKIQENRKKGDSFQAEQLCFIGPAETEAIDALVAKVAETGKAPTEDEVKSLLIKSHRGADIALFGRMLAAQPDFNVEAAAEVAHAVTVHKAMVEDDFFTAVDDLKDRDEADEEGAGAGFMGDTGFGAGVFYLYLCVNRNLLVDNLSGETGLAEAAVAALVEAAAKIGPSGKRASFGSRAYTSYLLAETGEQQPRSLSVAFLKPVTGTDVLTAAVGRLEETMTHMDDAYGATATDRYRMNVESGDGTLAGLLDFLAGQAPGNWSPAARAA